METFPDDECNKPESMQSSDTTLHGARKPALTTRMSSLLSTEDRCELTVKLLQRYSFKSTLCYCTVAGSS